MRSRVCLDRNGWCGRAAIAALMMAAGAAAAPAQTLTLGADRGEVVYATIRGGSYANRNLPTILETRASTNAEYLRRALIKFDTDHTIPAGTPIASATLTVTVRDGSGDPTRRVGVYQGTTSWTETQVTWNDRRTGQRWRTPGGDLGTRLAVQNVGNAPGTKVSFDVTPLVRQAVAGQLGSSRYTRLVLLDLDESTHDSWRSYYTPDASSSLRPVLRVVVGSGGSAAPPPSTPSSGGSCSVTLDRTALTVGSGEANWHVNVRAASSCAWAATSDASWLVVKSTAPSPAKGDGYAKLRAVANTTSASRRTGHLTVNGVRYTVTQGGCGSSCSGSSPAPSDPPSDPPPSTAPSTTRTLRVLHWNTHHGGVGTDGRLDQDRLIRMAASFSPDIISFNEVERYTGYGNVDDAALFASLMKKYTGRTWYYKFSTATGAANGNGNLVMSRFPFDGAEVKLLSHSRSAVNVTINVNGRSINFFSTHLDANTSSYRLAEIGELTNWSSGIAQQRIICGDFNAWPGSTENATMTRTYYDSWAEAKADGTAVAYAGNTAGNTRNSRIDYIYYSRGAGSLVLKSSRVYDTRDANGVMPSDHRPVLSVFEVR